MSRFTRTIIVTASAALALGCASRPDATRMVDGVSVRVAPRITHLPRDATYAWVSPDSLIRSLSATDREQSASPEVDLLRRDLDLLLRSHGWRRVPAELAEYELTLAHVSAGRARAAVGRDPRMAPCAPQAREQSICRHRPGVVDRKFDPTLITPQSTMIARVIRRRGDGAQGVSTVPLAGMKVVDLSAPVTEQMLLLFLGDERAR